MVSSTTSLKRVTRISLWWLSLLILAIPFLIPFFWMLSTAFKPKNEIFAFPIHWVPLNPTLDNFINGWNALPFAAFFKNTAIITLLCLIGEVFVSSFVAYGFARLRFKGRDLLFVILLATMMFPPQIVVTPLFVMFRKLNWQNTFYPLIIPCYFMGYGRGFLVFLLRQFLMGIPMELEDAARVDGASSFMIWLRIMLPLSKPALATAAIFSFIFHWNDFFYPLVFLDDLEKKTISLGLSLFKDQYSTMYGEACAVACIAMIPCIIIFLALQRYFVEGIKLAGIRE